jgi:hypothetical protein
MKKIARRYFIRTGGGIFLTYPLFSFSLFKFYQTERNRILLRTCWGTDTFGDLVSIPAICRLIQRFVPNTEVYIWPDKMNDDLRAMLEKNFTTLNLVTGKINDSGEPDTQELKEAFESADLFLYSPGTRKKIDWASTGMGIETRSLDYCQKKDLPYVIYGLGDIPETSEEQSAFINKMNSAALTFVTESISEGKIKNLKTKIENLKAGPDPLFAFDLKDDTGARHFLENNGLTDRNFVVVMSSQKDHSEMGGSGPEEKIVFLLENWINSTDHSILLIASAEEDADHFNKIHENLPEQIRSKVVLNDGMLAPDLLSSIIDKARIAAAISAYPLYPALMSDIPIFHFTDLSSDSTGQIFLDLGLKDYVADLMDISAEELLAKLSEINKAYVKALLDINKAQKEISKQLEQSYGEIYKLLEKINPTPKKKEQKKK